MRPNPGVIVGRQQAEECRCRAPHMPKGDRYVCLHGNVWEQAVTGSFAEWHLVRGPAAWWTRIRAWLHDGTRPVDSADYDAVEGGDDG